MRPAALLDYPAPMIRLMAYCALGLALPLSAVWAEPLVGDRAVYLQDQQGTQIRIASLTFDDAGRYEVVMDPVSFSDHFLSMRPFKCLEGPDKHWCHVPYPYTIARQASGSDVTDLEYDFLFLWKGATDYGINLWNGVYYRLTPEGDRLVGTLHEMDMNILSAPPGEGVLRPVRDMDLEPSDPDSHWLPVLVIE